MVWVLRNSCLLYTSMQDGKIKLDISGQERDRMTVEKLIEKFEIDNDRMLL